MPSLLVVVVFLPTLLAGAVIGASRLARRVRAARPRKTSVAVGPPIERIAADLRRLNVERREQQGGRRRRAGARAGGR